MGVIGLKPLIRKLGNKNVPTHFYTTVIDGMNLLCYAMRNIRTEMAKTNGTISEWSTLDADIITQLTSFTNDVIIFIVNYCKNLFKISEHVIYVVDGPQQPYHIDRSFNYPKEYEELISPELAEFGRTAIDPKTMERKRRQSSSSSEYDTFDASTDKLELSQKQFDVLKQIYNQITQFDNISGMLPLKSYIIQAVFSKLDSMKFRVVLTDDEADLIIKRIATESIKRGETLVISNDNDFYVLFSDTPQVYVTPNEMDTQQIKNPCEVFKELGFSSYSQIIRLSAILGNDYTAHESLAELSSIRDIAQLFQTKTIEQIDKHIISHTSPEYSRGYLLSNLLYENWDKFNKYREFDKPCISDLKKSLKESLSSIYRYQTRETNGHLRVFGWNKCTPFKGLLWVKKFFEHGNLKCIVFDNVNEFVEFLTPSLNSTGYKF